MSSGLSSPLHESADRTIVGRVRVRVPALTRAGGSVDRGGARARVESELAQLSMQAAGLSPSSVLCIRSLHDPLPGALDLGTRSHARDAWSAALLRTIADAARAAVRPIDGSVPAGATAVLFHDRAELLACLARDWSLGDIVHHWWWKHLIRPHASGRAAPAQWIAEARYVPAATRLLAERNALAHFAEALNEDEAHALVQAIFSQFALSASHDALHAMAALDRAEPVRAPWAAWAPEARHARLGPAAQAFVGVSLTIARAASFARTPSFVAEVTAWLGSARSPTAFPERDASSPTRGPRLSSVDSPLPAFAFDEPSAPHDSSLSSASRVADSVDDARDAIDVAFDAADDPSARPSRDALRFDAIESDPAAIEPEREPISALAPHRAIDETHVPSPLDAPSPIASTEHARAPFVPATTPIEALDPGAPAASEETPFESSQPRSHAPTFRIRTEYGGAFFLLNVLLALELYGDFTQPLSRALFLSPWTVVHRLSRILLGEKADADDPLWSLLGELAQGEDGGDAAWPDDWRIDPDLLAAFPERTGWTWCSSDTRLCIIHPAGFAVAVVSREADVDAQLARELDRHRVLSATENASTPIESRYAHLLARFVRARVHRAFTNDVDGDDADTAVRRALSVAAEVHVTDAHVDVAMSLADLPIEVRLAGLDRDPGWIPSATHHIAFHFE